MALLYDPDEAIQTLSAADPILGRAIQHIGSYTLEVRDMHTPFEALLRSIVYQQLSGKAAGTIYGRVLKLFPDQDNLTPEDLLHTPDEDLRGAGLSRAKTAAVKDLAAKTIAGIVPDLHTLQQMPDTAIVERLTQVRGIGPWTVEMLLMFRLGRPDIWPVTDLGIRKGFMQLFHLDDLPKPSALRAYGTRWQPYRSVASWYLWRVADSDDTW